MNPTEIEWLKSFEIDWTLFFESVAWIAGVLVIAAIAHLIASRLILRGISKLVKRSSIWWDDVIAEEKVFERLAPIAPALVIRWGMVFVPNLGEDIVDLVQRVVVATIVMVVARAASAFLGAVNAIYTKYEVARGRPIKSYIQVVQIAVYLFALIYAVAALMNESPWYFLTGLGAMTAVLLVIFRDTLLSLVAGVQLTNNDLIRVGDWIEMPNFGADGDVVDIALNVVKVKNWDATITVIPTHKFLEHSFKNWRNVFEAGGRRIKRSLLIDMNTIRFLSEEEIEKFSKIQVLHEYIERKKAELKEHNAKLPEGAQELMVNKRWLTNIGTLRAYLVAYLRTNPQIHEEFSFLVRQLQPTESGLPIEIYVFSKDTRWAYYEAIQADIFDHLIAILPEFGLRAFQAPAGRDFEALNRSILADHTSKQLPD